MPKSVKLVRSYHSPRRREQAAETRRVILNGATRLFESQGYAATTMAGIAAEAGVALKTVYLAFETKSGILRELWNLCLRGDEDEAPVAERRWFREVLDELNPERQLRLNAQNSRIVKLRIASVTKLVRQAANADPDIRVLWERIQHDFHDNQRMIVKSISEKGALHPSLDVAHATDILWTINHPDMWDLLVGQRRWSAEQYEQWCGDVACAQLLARRSAYASGR